MGRKKRRGGYFGNLTHQEPEVEHQEPAVDAREPEPEAEPPKLPPLIEVRQTCPHCHSPRWRVIYTRVNPNGRVAHRRCRNCLEEYDVQERWRRP